MAAVSLEDSGAIVKQNTSVNEFGTSNSVASNRTLLGVLTVLSLTASNCLKPANYAYAFVTCFNS